MSNPGTPKPMKIPSKFVIKGKQWSVVYKPKLNDPELGECNALVDWMESTIFIDRNLPRNEKAIALLHEIIHILLDEYHLHETGGIQDKFAEEVICAGLAKSLLEIFNIQPREIHKRAVFASRNKK
jgi:hypothetical protein